MRTHLRVLGLLPLVLFGCGPTIMEPRPDACGGVSGGVVVDGGSAVPGPFPSDGGSSSPGGTVFGPAFAAGKDAQVQLLPSIRFDCQGRGIPPEAAEVTVYDPDNHEVPNDAHLETSASSATLTVTFRPEVPGVYHVLARFDPVGGVQQASVLVGENHERAPDVSFGRSCGLLHRTSAGTLLCDGHPVGEDGSVPESPFFAAVAVHGNAVWRLTSGTLSLHEDTGEGGLSLRAEGALPSAVEALVAGEGFAALLVDGQLWTAWPTQEGGLTLQEGHTLPSEAASPRLVVMGPRVYAVQSISTVDADGGAFLQYIQVCAYSVRPDVPPQIHGDCQSLPGALAGADTDEVWTVSVNPRGPGTSVRRYQDTAQGLEETARLDSPITLGLLYPGSTFPSFLPDGQPLLVPRAEAGTVALEHYGVPGGGQVSAGAGFVVHMGEQGTRVWLRNAAP